MTKAKFRTFSILFSTIVHKHKKIMTYCFNINDLLRSFNKITWRRKCYLKHFCWFIIIINGMKLNCKTYSTTDGVQELASQIQDFFRTFSAPLSNLSTFQILKNPNSNFSTFQDPWESCVEFSVQTSDLKKIIWKTKNLRPIQQYAQLTGTYSNA